MGFVHQCPLIVLCIFPNIPTFRKTRHLEKTSARASVHKIMHNSNFILYIIVVYFLIIAVKRLSFDNVSHLEQVCLN